MQTSDSNVDFTDSYISIEVVSNIFNSHIFECGIRCFEAMRFHFEPGDGTAVVYSNRFSDCDGLDTLWTSSNDYGLRRTVLEHGRVVI